MAADSVLPEVSRAHICGQTDGVCASCYPQKRRDGFPDRETTWHHFTAHLDGQLGKYVVVKVEHTVVAVVDDWAEAQQWM